MKNLSIVFFALIFLFSCTEDIITPEPDVSKLYNSDGERLKFNSEDDFLAFMLGEDRHVSTNNYPSRKKTDKSHHKVAEVPDALNKILNNDNVFQVQNWIIRLNFDTRRVWVIDVSFIDKLYSDLINEVASQHVMNFSMDYDVFEL